MAYLDTSATPDEVLYKLDTNAKSSFNTTVNFICHDPTTQRTIMHRVAHALANLGDLATVDVRINQSTNTSLDNTPF